MTAVKGDEVETPCRQKTSRITEGIPATIEDQPSIITFPRQGYDNVTQRPEKLLLLCYYDPSGISTVPETVANIQYNSVFDISVMNLCEHRQDMGYLKLHPSVDIERFDGIVIHNSVAYNIDNLKSLDALMPKKFKQYGGVKILMKQDENYRCIETADHIAETGYDIIFTCLPDNVVESVYPSSKIGRPHFERMLTGYVTPKLRSIPFDTNDRPIDIGYRGSTQPLSFGRLAFEKRKIGDDVRRLLAGTDLRLDISSRWEDRFGGDAWFDFLRSCKAILGTESGASIFDLGGDLEKRCRDIEGKIGQFRDDHEYAESYLNRLAGFEGNIYYNQISPRHFEAIASGALQILYEGNYSGILRPDRHFFPLKRDYSNLAQAVEIVRDDSLRGRMVTAAYNEILLNKEYWIETFVHRFDRCAETALKSKGRFSKIFVTVPDSTRNVLLIAAHEPSLDPRLGWIEHRAPDGIRIHQLGSSHPSATKDILQYTKRNALVISHPRVSYRPGMLDRWYSSSLLSPAGMAGINELKFIEASLAMPDEQFCRLFGAPMGCERVGQFRWYLRYILDTSATLIGQAVRLRGVHVIIATDLDTLPVALALKGILSVPVVYDAHEYWPESDVASFEFEKQFWIGIERRMLVHVDYAQTVSPGLAQIMSAQYHRHFETVPNAESKSSALPAPTRRNDNRECIFVFQGNFAHGRGLDLLIAAWPKTDNRAVLLLRGPDNAYKDKMIALASSMGILGTRVKFPNAVAEAELVRAAAEGDVGVVPYSRAGTAYLHCCPNKMSQYMAAHLPILANDTIYVSHIVKTAGCGEVMDFARTEQLIQSVNRLTNDQNLRHRYGQRGHDFFLNEFNWEVCSRPLYEALDLLTRHRPDEPLRFFEVNIVTSPAVEITWRPPTPTSTSDIIAYSPSIPEKPQGIVRSLRVVWKMLPPETRYAIRKLARSIHLRVQANGGKGMLHRLLMPIWKRLPTELRIRFGNLSRQGGV